MKRLLMLAIPLLAVGASADEVSVKGRLKYIDYSPNIVMVLDTDFGLRRVSLGPAENWKGRLLWLDHNDFVSVTGQKMTDSLDITADRVWVNGNWYVIPTGPMKGDSK